MGIMSIHLATAITIILSRLKPLFITNTRWISLRINNDLDQTQRDIFKRLQEVLNRVSFRKRSFKVQEYTIFCLLIII